MLANPLQFVGTSPLRFTGNHRLVFTEPVAAVNTASIDLSADAALVFAGGMWDQTLRTLGAGTLDLAWYRGRGIDARSGRVNFIAGNNATSSRVESLSIAAAAVVDLNDHTLVIDGAGATGESSVRGLLVAMRWVRRSAAKVPAPRPLSNAQHTRSVSPPDTSAPPARSSIISRRPES